MHNTEQTSPWRYNRLKQRVLLPFETKKQLETGQLDENKD
jgi:hypothetical protein